MNWSCDNEKEDGTWVVPVEERKGGRERGKRERERGKEGGQEDEGRKERGERE